MKLDECRLTDQIFSVHYTPEGGGPTVLRHFNASALLRRWRRSPFGPPVSAVEISRGHAQTLIVTRGIEQPRVRYHVMDFIQRERAPTPIVFVDCDDGTQLQIDGHHKYVAAAMVGMSRFPAVFFPRGTWEWVEITNIPQAMVDLLASEIPDNREAEGLPQMSLKRYDRGPQ